MTTLGAVAGNGPVTSRDPAQTRGRSRTRRAGRRAGAVTGAGLLALATAAGGYAVGHRQGEVGGHRAALAGLTQQALDLARSISLSHADTAVSASTPGAVAAGGAAALDCEAPNQMVRFNACAAAQARGATTGSGVGTPPGTAGGVPLPGTATRVDDGTAVLLGRQLAARLRAQADAGAGSVDDLSLIRRAFAGAPRGSRLGHLLDANHDGVLDDGAVQLSAPDGGVACIIEATLVEAGACYDRGQQVDDKGGYYTPKRFTPGYAATL